MKDILPRKRVLITGGAGFIGANLIKKLLKLKYNVHLILKKSSNLWRIKDVLDKVKIYNVDLLEKEKLTEVISKINPDFIIHLATFSDYRQQTSVEKMVDTNIKGTLNLLLASKNISYKLFINTGSSSEYGIKEKPMNESDLLEPISFYAATKSSATLLCQVFSKEYKKPIVTFRPFSAYGPFEEKDRLIPTIIKAVIKNEPIKLTSGKERRDFIYIDDIVNIYIKAIKKGKELSGQVLNMGTGTEHTNDEIAETLFKVTGKRVKVIKGAYPKRIWDTSHWIADISKTKKMLNWKPKFTLMQGLRYTYNWTINE